MNLGFLLRPIGSHNKMKTLVKNKGILVAVLVFTLVMSLYNMFKVDLVPAETPPENIGSDLVELFVSLEGVSLESDFLSSPLYNALSDFSEELEPQSAGRSNPFNEIGRD